MIEKRKKENKNKTVNYICPDISVCNTDLQRGLKKNNAKWIYHFLFAKLGTLIWYLLSCFLLAPIEGLCCQPKYWANTLNQIIFYFYLFFLSVLGIPSWAEQKNLGERGDPSKALRRAKRQRAPLPHCPIFLFSCLPLTVSSRFLSGPSSKRRSCSSKALFDTLKGYPVPSFHGQIVPRQNVPLDSQIVPRSI